MAKLNGVQAVGEAIEYNDVKYEKVKETPKAGDILRVDGSIYSYVTEDAYYEVDHVDSHYDPQIIDNDGDVFDGAEIEYTLFRKVSESQTQQYREVNRKAKVSERIKIVEPYMTGGRYKKGDELIVYSVDRDDSGDVRVIINGERALVARKEYVVLEPIAEQSDDIIVVDGVKYRKADRAPRVGDFVYATESVNNLTKGKLYPVYDVDGGGDGVFWRDNGHRGYYPNNSRGRVLVERIATAEDLERQVSELQTKLSEAEAELAAKKAEEEAKAHKASFEVGDYARVVAESFEHEVGHVVKISGLESEGSYFDFSVNRITLGGLGYIKAKNIEKISAEEAEEIAKWAAIGRKVGELKEGDLIEITRYQGGDKVGTIASVDDVHSNYVDYKSDNSARGSFRACKGAIKLIAPVESVVNLAVAN